MCSSLHVFLRSLSPPPLLFFHDVLSANFPSPHLSQTRFLSVYQLRFPLLIKDPDPPACLVPHSRSSVARPWASLVFVGLIAYSEKTLGVLMLRLRGLFNSANRHRKTHVSAVLLRLQFSRRVEPDGGLFLQMTSASSPPPHPDRRLTPSLTYAYYGRPELPVYAASLSNKPQ